MVISKKQGWLIAVIAFIGILFYAYRCGRNLGREMSEHLTVVNYADSDYLALFRPEVINDISVSETYLSINRNPMSVFRYKDKYIIAVCRIDLKTKMPLNTILRSNKRPSGQTPGVAYSGSSSIYYAWLKQGRVDKIYFNYEGALSTVEHNDSVYSYLYTGKNLSLQYDSIAPVDILLDYRKRKRDVSFDINFWRKEQSVYFILLYNNLGQPGIIDEDVLRSLLHY